MAKKTRKNTRPACDCSFCSNMACGLYAFLFGLIRYSGYEWEYAFMAIGILIALKSLIWCRK